MTYGVMRRAAAGSSRDTVAATGVYHASVAGLARKRKRRVTVPFRQLQAKNRRRLVRRMISRHKSRVWHCHIVVVDLPSIVWN